MTSFINNQHNFILSHHQNDQVTFDTTLIWWINPPLAEQRWAHSLWLILHFLTKSKPFKSEITSCSICRQKKKKKKNDGGVPKNDKAGASGITYPQRSTSVPARWRECWVAEHFESVYLEIMGRSEVLPECLFYSWAIHSTYKREAPSSVIFLRVRARSLGEVPKFFFVSDDLTAATLPREKGVLSLDGGRKWGARLLGCERRRWVLTAIKARK